MNDKIRSASHVRRFGLAGIVAAPLLVAGCAQMPVGPSIAVMPSPSKPFEVFMADDAACRDWAARGIGAMPQDATTQAFLGSALTGAAIGAAVGGIAGGHQGAGTGAAIGTAAGAMAGANQSAYIGYDAQRRYDIAYSQCMYAKGNQVPGAGYAPRRAAAWAPPPPPSQLPMTAPPPVPAR